MITEMVAELVSQIPPPSSSCLECIEMCVCIYCMCVGERLSAWVQSAFVFVFVYVTDSSCCFVRHFLWL